GVGRASIWATARRRASALSTRSATSSPGSTTWQSVIWAISTRAAYETGSSSELSCPDRAGCATPCWVRTREFRTGTARTGSAAEVEGLDLGELVCEVGDVGLEQLLAEVGGRAGRVADVPIGI